jgi:hypothetical protein
MTRICISIILLLSILTLSSKSYSQDDFPVLEDPYLGQKPPGLIPELFAKQRKNFLRNTDPTQGVST